MKPHVTRLWESQCERLYGMKFIPRCLPSLFVLCRLTTVSVALYTQEAEQGSWVGGGWRVMMDGWVRGAGCGRWKGWAGGEAAATAPHDDVGADAAGVFNGVVRT